MEAYLFGLPFSDKKHLAYKVCGKSIHKYFKVKGNNWQEFTACFLIFRKELQTSEKYK